MEGLGMPDRTSALVKVLPAASVQEKSESRNLPSAVASPFVALAAKLLSACSAESSSPAAKPGCAVIRIKTPMETNTIARTLSQILINLHNGLFEPIL